MAVEIGQQAPDFACWVCDGEKFQPFKLSEHIGKENIILAFFPFAFSSVCTKEVCQVRDDHQKFGKMGAQVYGISVDSPFALNAFMKEHKLNFKQLSDFNKTASKTYGVLHEELAGFKGVSKRSVFIIDRAGSVRYRWVSDVPTNMPNFDELQKALKTMQE